MDANSPKLPPKDDRALEDYIEGALYEFGSISVGEDEIIAFASKFDPQDMHTDPIKAAKGAYGGLVASGWHTTAIMMRLFADNFLPLTASLGSPGVENLRWLAPVRPGDRLSIRVTVLEARLSRSHTDRGIVKTSIEALNQDDVPVLSLQAVSILATRAALTGGRFGRAPVG